MIFLTLLLLILAIYFQRLFLIENAMRTLDGFKLATQIQITSLLGLCSAFFSGFAISSRILCYMHLFQAFVILESFILCIFIVYGIIYGETSFMKEANLDKRNGGSVLFSNIEAQYGPKGTDAKTLEFINDVHKSCNNKYLLITMIMLGLNLICFVITKICTKIKLVDADIILPQVRTSERVGMSSSSLRKRHMSVRQIYPLDGVINENI